MFNVNSGSSFLVLRPLFPAALGSTEAKYLIFAKAPELIWVFALNWVPVPIFCPLRGSWEPEFKRMVAILTELKVLLTRLFKSSSSLVVTPVLDTAPWAREMTSLAFSNTSLVVSWSGNSRSAAFNCSRDSFKESFLFVGISFSLFDDSSDFFLASDSVGSVLSLASSSLGLLDSLFACDKVATSLFKSDANSSTSFWTASALLSIACPLWTLSLIEERRELSRFNGVERRPFSSSKTVLICDLSAVLRRLSVVIGFSCFTGLSSTSTLFSAVSLLSSTFSGLSVPSFGDSSFAFTKSAVDWLLPFTVSALATCAPKNISAAIATDAAPNLYLRIL